MIDWFDTLEFRHPWLLLAALSALLAFYWSRRSAGRVVFSSFRALPAARSWRARLAWLPDALIALAVIGLSVAMAGPRTPDSTSRVERKGIAIMMVVDLSSSMRALDLSTDDRELTRLDAVKEVFEDFVLEGGDLEGRPNDIIGLVSFARYADTRCPLTLDHANLAGLARTLQMVTDREEDGTAIGDGLGLAVERLRDSKARSKVIILLTDGVNNAGEEDPLAAADLAHAKGIKVYTIGAGTNGLAPMRVEMPSGRSVLRPVPVSIDEGILREIAERTEGQYFRATDHDGLEQVYQQIDELERTELSEEHFRQYSEHYRLALGAGLLLAALAWLLAGTVFRRLP